MTQLAITSPLPQFFNADGSPLTGGKVYIGLPGLNPETAPVSVYWDAAATQPAAQPLTTNGGYIHRTGSPARVYAPSAFSLTVRNSIGALVLYVPLVEAPGASLINELTASLISTTDSSKGAGMVGYGPSVPYPANTVGAELRTAQSQVEHFWRAVRNNQRDVYIIVTGDSTGNEQTEWVYLMAQWLATQCPTHTIKYRLFNDGTTSWDSYSTLQTGTGPALPYTLTPFTIYIDNGSVSGTNTFYTQGARESAFWTGNDYDLAFVNYGHNLGTAMTESIAMPEWVVALSHVRLMAPRAGMLVTLQNPRSSVTGDINTNGSAQSARMVAAWRKVVELIGAGVIDVYTAFSTNPNYPSLMADETHPSPAGSLVWLEEVKRVMAEPVRMTGDAPLGYNPLAELRPNFAPNPRFSTWTSSTPDGWAFTNCTATKDLGITDGSLYSMRLTVTAAGAQVTADVSSYLKQLSGKTITFVARVWRPSNLGLLGGRIELISTDDVTSSESFLSYPRGTPSAGGWEWAIATLKVPRNHTRLTLRIYVGAADATDNGKSIWVDSVWLGPGWLPGQASLESVSSKFVLDYYGSSNVGKVAGTGGTLTVASNSITLAGASGASDCYLNLPGLTPGKQYRVTFNGNACTGNTGGNYYIRNGYNGGFTTLSSSTWSVGSSTSLTFTAPNGPICVQFAGFTGTTGFVLDQWSIKPTESGIARPFGIPLNTGKNADGTTLAATPPVGGFAISNTAGVVTCLLGEQAQGNTKTDAATWEVTLPSDYVAGRDVTLTVNAYASGVGTLGATKTLTLTAYLISDTVGTHGSNLGPAAATITTSAADYAFTINGATLSPGNRIQLRLTMAVQETGGASALVPRINSMRLA